MYDVIIIGSGPAGLTAAIYSKRAMLNVIVAEKDYMGTGQISVTERVDNYPGLYGINGFDLGEKFRDHATQSGAEFYEGQAVSITRNKDIWNVEFADGSTLSAKAVIYAAGTSYRRLEVKGGDKQRISYCAVCDGAFYKGKTVAVIGGGDTALGDALYLSKIAEKVYIIHRRDEFRGNKSLQAQVLAAGNVEPIMCATVAEVKGDTKAEAIVINQNGDLREIAVDGIFCAMGSVPNSDLLKGVCNLDNSGYIKANEDCKTSELGLFAAGDVRTTPLRQVITAAADGANAAVPAEKYISGLVFGK